MKVLFGNSRIMIIGFVVMVSIVSLAGCGNKNVNPPTPQPPPSGNVIGNVPNNAGDGVTFINNGTSAIFNLYAPNKKQVYLLGSFNNWRADTASKMANTPDGTRWWIQINNLNPSQLYSYVYFIDGAIKVADPYAHMILDSANDRYIPSSVYPNIPAYPAGQGGTAHIVSVAQANPPSYTWQVSNFQRPSPSNLVVYELWLGDFLDQDNTPYNSPNFATPNNIPSYQTLLDSLNYIADLGVNAIELLPVNEFEGNTSWGYNPNFMFALDKYYGTPNAYKAFIDACHRKGIAVIQDIVLEDQFGSSPMVQMYWNAQTQTPAQNSPWFDSLTLHPYGVGYQLNHQSAATQYWAENVMKYWLQEYHIDGFRFDQAQGYTQTNSITNPNLWSAYDASRIALWTKYNDTIQSLTTSNNPYYVILENFAESAEIKAMAQQGMICWNNESSAGEQAAMGWSTNPSWDLSPLTPAGFGIGSEYPNGIISYFESHDEERLQYKNEQWGNAYNGYNVQNLTTGLSRDGMMAAFLFSVPGPKMLWQFGERGYDLSKNSDNLGMGKTSYGSLAPMPANWNYMTDANRVALYKVYAQMIHYKINNPVFTTANYTYSLSNAVKWIQLLGSDGTDVVVVGNCDVAPQTATINFPAVGTWYDNLLGTTMDMNATSQSITLQPGEYHVYSNVALK